MTPTTTLRSAIEAQIPELAIEYAKLSHERNYHKLYAHRSGDVAWSEFPDQTSDLIDRGADGFAAVLTLADTGTGSCGCNCDYCNEVYDPTVEQHAAERGHKYDRRSKFDTQAEAIAEAVSNSDLSEIEAMMDAALAHIPVGYFNDEVANALR